MDDDDVCSERPLVDLYVSDPRRGLILQNLAIRTAKRRSLKIPSVEPVVKMRGG